MTDVTLRPESDADEAFSRAVYAATRADEMTRVPWTEEQKAAFVSMQFEAQRAHYREHFATASFDVVVVDGEDAGRLYVGRYEHEIRVVDVALLPPYRGRGVGTRLLSSLLDEARASGRRVVIHVEHENPARTLYDRLGFVPVEDVGAYLRMEWTSGATGAP